MVNIGGNNSVVHVIKTVQRYIFTEYRVKYFSSYIQKQTFVKRLSHPTGVITHAWRAVAHSRCYTIISATR